MSVPPDAALSPGTWADDVDDFIRGQLQTRHIPGLAIAVVRDGTVIRSAGYGSADVENEIPVNPNTVFKIGSLSKQFIAAGIMLLVQDGQLPMDDPVHR